MLTYFCTYSPLHYILRFSVSLFIICTVFSSQLYGDEEEMVPGKFVVSFSATENQRAWIVKALEQNIYNDLAGYGRVIPVTKSTKEDQKCKENNVDCLIDLYRRLNIDALMLGVVNKKEVLYEVYDIHRKSLVRTGSIPIGPGSSMLNLRKGAFTAFKPFIEKGGILDQRKYRLKTNRRKYYREVVEISRHEQLMRNVFLLFLVLFTFFPYVLSFKGNVRKHPERKKIIHNWFFPFQLLCLIGIVVQISLIPANSPSNIFQIFLELFRDFHWVPAVMGGMAWGYFLIANLRIVMPHLQGIERIKQKPLFPLLRAIFITSFIKLLFFSICYVGFFFAVQYVGKLFIIRQDMVIIFLYPISGLYIFYWTGLVLEVFAMDLDAKLSSGPVDYNNIWDDKLRKYFISYLKRNGVSLNKRLVKRIVFLPGKHKGVFTYGSIFTRPRIVINEKIIKYAIGDTNIVIPEKINSVSKDSLIAHILPSLAKYDKSVKRKRKRMNARKLQYYLYDAEKFMQKDLNRRDAGKNHITPFKALQGYIYPMLIKDADAPPLISDSLDDISAVEELLLDDSLLLAPYDDELEVDDSSYKDKDFLFGIMLHSSGAFLRYDQLFSTFFLFFGLKRKLKKGPNNFLFAKYFSIVADTFVVLNFGHQHLTQYLYFRATNKRNFLTTRGNSGALLHSYTEILNRVKDLIHDRKLKIYQTDDFDRIIWLSNFGSGTIEQQKKTPLRRYVKIAFTTSTAGILFLFLFHSFLYHPIYVQIIEEEKREIAEAIKKAQERKENDRKKIRQKEEEEKANR